MYIIKVFSDFCDSTTCKKNFENVYHLMNYAYYGINQKYYFTDGEDYTHAIILNKAIPIIKVSVPKENVIGLACEPYEFLQIDLIFIEYAKKNIHKYYIGTKNDLPDPFIENHGFLWFSQPIHEITIKHKWMSIMVSQKTFAPGHQYRHLLVENIIHNNLPIDIYGRGCEKYKSPLVKGVFTNVEPYEDYLFTISIENFQNNHYFSEKIVTPMMHNCMPIYWGCKKIQNYFDEVILLNGNLQHDLNLIVTILKEPSKYYKKTYTEQNKKTTHLLENLDTLYL